MSPPKAAQVLTLFCACHKNRFTICLNLATDQFLVRCDKCGTITDLDAVMSMLRESAAKERIH